MPRNSPLRDRGVHGVQPAALSLTQITERGTAYTLDEIAAS
jgi:threonine aldolase